ncbi:IS5 family transposase [Zooshikella harenae]|uniref:IS5 family transposase n=1 Tax=Zooshikella harenae TaxID=2827238 RepID=A0ABS5ZJX4_9GAMM|nr:IS5 family transposase [Zooshikella harenae]MBU2714382.1 IS5 family transposase [Zooshikella harenae]
MLQPGFFDLKDRYNKLNERDPLVSLNALIDWENFRATLNEVRQNPRKSQAGRKPFDVVLMFKVLVLQHLYNLSDDETEYQIRDRYSFCRFLNLTPEDRIPDAKTIWLYREQLVLRDLMKGLFNDFDDQLNDKGYKAQKGQMVDASFVDVPKQRNKREENQQIKSGEIPERFENNPNVGRQKDTDARWTKKNEETHFGYKNHVTVDNAHKLIRDYKVTSAEVHDSQVFIEILAENTSADVWADSAYQSENNEISLAAMNMRSHVHKKGKKNKPLSERSKKANTRRSKVRARVEHVFGSITNEQGGLYSRVIGFARNQLKIGMMNIVYNMRRFMTLSRKSVPAI